MKVSGSDAKGFTAKDVFSKFYGDASMLPQKFETIEEAEFSMPKFSIESLTEGIHNFLAQSGYDHLLNAGALSGISDDPRLKLSFIFQAAKIDINEKGGEASAATVAGSALESMSVDPTISIDRSFAYAIVDTKEDTMFFEGIVEKPEYNE